MQTAVIPFGKPCGPGGQSLPRATGWMALNLAGPRGHPRRVNRGIDKASARILLRVH